MTDRDLERGELRELVGKIAADPQRWRAVVEGEVVEERLVLGGAPRELRHRAGEVFDFDASHVHRMRHENHAPAVTIHAYSPPLWRMGAYVVAPDGTLRRRSISYAEELRPFEEAA